jgi:hypothetical protein
MCGNIALSLSIKYPPSTIRHSADSLGTCFTTLTAERIFDISTDQLRDLGRLAPSISPVSVQHPYKFCNNRMSLAVPNFLSNACFPAFFSVPLGFRCLDVVRQPFRHQSVGPLSRGNTFRARSMLEIDYGD